MRIRKILYSSYLMLVTIFVSIGPSWAAAQTDESAELGIEQSALAAVIGSEAPNPFSPATRVETLENVLRELQNSSARALSEVLELENQLVASEERLVSWGYESPEDFLKEIADRLASLPADTRDFISSARDPHTLLSDPTSREKIEASPAAKELIELIRSADEILGDHFQELRIQHSKSYFRLALALGFLNIYELSSQMKKSDRSMSEQQREKYHRLFSSLKREASNYLAHEHEFEGPRRNTAVIPHNHFLRSLKKFESLVQLVEKIEVTANKFSDDSRISKNQRTYARIFSRGLSAFFYSIASLPNFVFQLVQAIVSVRTDRAYFSESSSNLFSVDNYSPRLTSSVVSLHNALARVLGYSVEVEGAEHIQSNQMRGVTIVTPSHRDALRDMIAISALRFQKMTMYANAGQILNMIFGRREKFKFLGFEIDMVQFKSKVVAALNRGTSILVAGNTFNPDSATPEFKPVFKSVQMMTALSKAFKDMVLLNYPHGALPSWLGLDLPIVRSWFGPSGTLAAAWRQGIQPQLLIVTLPWNVDPLGLGLIEEHRAKRIKVKVHGLVPGDLMHSIVALGGHRVLQHLFEANSNLGLVSDSWLHRGHIHADKLNVAMRRFLGRSVESQVPMAPICRGTFGL